MINKKNTKHYKWGNNCDSWIFHESQNLSIKYELMPPNTSEVLHYHNKVEQFFFILNGKASFELNNKIYLVKRKEGILIEPKTKHFIKNETEEFLEFLVVSCPTADYDRVNIK